MTALACYYIQIPVEYIEAGLRTYDIYSSYPKEFNHQAVSIISQYNFIPTKPSEQNLLKEGKKAESVYVTGNTAIDTFKTTVSSDYVHRELDCVEGSLLLIITAHRHENLTPLMHNLFIAIRRIINERQALKTIYSIHMNPILRQVADEELGGRDRNRLLIRSKFLISTIHL